MIPAEETFDGTFPFAPRFFDGHGFRQHFVDEGEGEVVVCLHGEPTWGYLYRKVIPPLAERYRVIVPDHMGFGKSETPQDREYSLRSHTENLTALLDHLDVTDVTLVMQDWGGPMGCSWAVRRPDRVTRLVLANTVSPFAPPDRLPPQQGRTPWFQWVADGYDTGRYEAVLRNLGTTVLSVMKLLGFENTAAVDDTWIRAYSAPFPTPQECLAAYEFPLDVHLQRIRDFVVEGFPLAGAIHEKPAVLIEGMRDKAIDPERAIASFRAQWPNGPVTTHPDAGHFLQEDIPRRLAALVDQFVQSTP